MRKARPEEGETPEAPAKDRGKSDARPIALEIDDGPIPPDRLSARVNDENAALLRRQRDFRRAAEYVASDLARIEAVRRVVLFGSVAAHLWEEVPRFQPFRRQGIALLHECNDVDLAVWTADLGSLHALARARVQALRRLLSERKIGVAHHQVDIFLLEPGTDRYLGRLCDFATCPKGKVECFVPGCGESPFLRRHAEFVFDPAALAPERTVPLFEREAA